MSFNIRISEDLQINKTGPMGRLFNLIDTVTLLHSLKFEL